MMTKIGVTKISFFIAGVYAGNLSMQGKRLNAFWLLALAVLLLVSYKLSFEGVVIVRESLRRLLGIPICCLILLMAENVTVFMAPLRLLGAYSLEIYIMHMLLRGITVDYVSDIWWAASLPIILTLLLCKPTHWACKKIISKL